MNIPHLGTQKYNYAQNGVFFTTMSIESKGTIQLALKNGAKIIQDENIVRIIGEKYSMDIKYIFSIDNQIIIEGSDGYMQHMILYTGNKT